MKQVLLGILLLAGLGAGRAARAQYNPALYYHPAHCCHCCCHCQRDTATLTERSNRVSLLYGALLLVDKRGTAYGGGSMEVSYAVRPRLSVGGYALATFQRAAATNYGYEATAPAVGLYGFAGTARYQLRNSRRWRVEALGSLGVGCVNLVDRDRQVANNRGNDTHAATVAFRAHPLAEVGLSGIYKVSRSCWLTSRLSYTNLALSSGLGEAGEFSYWQASVGVAIPWGWH